LSREILVFRSKTLFIVGAGASCEVDLPSGDKLKELIAEKLDIRFETGRGQVSGDIQIMETLRHYSRDAHGAQADVNVYRAAACQTAAAMPQSISIDNFIDAHRHEPKIELCGKLAIVKSILQAERRSKLWFDENRREKLDFAQLGGTWYSAFFQRLSEGVARDGIDGLFENVSFITFNYDRCIEHHIVNALQSYYLLSAGQAQEVARNLIVRHPYGLVGSLLWQEIGSAAVPFGGSDPSDPLLRLAKQIKTFTEQVEEGTELEAIRRQVRDARVIVFLGFGFADQNMDLLKPGGETAVERIFATAHGISDSDCRVIEAQLAGVLGRSGAGIQLRNDKKCAALFGEYWRTLTQ
jgi:hypothetical protein